MKDRPTAQRVTVGPNNRLDRTVPRISVREGGWALSGTCIVQRGKKFAVVAYAGIDPETKKPRQKWFGGFRTRREADQFQLSLAHSPAFSAGAGPYGSPRLRTRDYLKTWLQERKTLGSLRPSTADRYDYSIRLHIAPCIGHLPIIRLAGPAIQAMYVKLLERGLSPSTVRRAATLLHTAMRDALQRGLVRQNPVDQTTPPRNPRFEPTILTLEQVAVYMADTRDNAPPALAALYAVIVGTGMRLGEALALGERDVDLDHGTLQVNRTLLRPGGHPEFGPPKSERGRRSITLPDEALAALRAAVLWRKEQRLRLGPRWSETGLVCCSTTGTALNRHNVRRDHLDRLKRLELPRMRVHDLRHLHATHLAASGVDYRTIADRLGHASPSFTLGTYAHAAARAQERAAIVANELLIKTGVSGQ